MRWFIYIIVSILVISTVFATNFNNDTVDSYEAVCGNDKRELPDEQCDPPDKNCYTANFEDGYCTNECKCIAFGRHSICGNDIKEPEEDCEKDKHCTTGEVCDDCSCITPIVETETIEVNTTEINKTVNNVTEELDVIEEEIEEPIVRDSDLERENFDDSVGIKITSGVTKVAKALFGWLINLVW